MIVSLILAIVEPISAAMLAHLIVSHRIVFLGRVVIRAWVAVLAIGLVIHAVQQMALLVDYSPPRHWLWLPLIGSVNALIWSAFFVSQRRRRPS